MDLAVVFVIVALVIGLSLGWMFGQRSGAGSARAAVAELAAAQAQVLAVETRSSGLATRVSDLEQQVAAARGAAEASRERAETLQAQLTAQTRLDDLLKPIKDAVGTLQTQTSASEVKRAEADSAIKEQIEALRLHNESLLRETTRLAGALAKTGTRGQWGEAQLEKLLESAGLLKGVNYKTQDSRTTIGEAGQRPDVAVSLPGGGELFIDAKVPFERYLEAMALEDGAERRARFEQHAKDVLSHARALNKREYQKGANSPNFVVMFLPLESLLSTALEHDALLLENAFRENVVLATPTSMLALLRTIAYGWSQETAARNVREITELGQELHDRLQKLVRYIGTVGNRIEQTAAAYNEMVGSLQTRVLVTARKIGEKSGRSEHDLEELEGVSTARVQLRSLPPVPREAIESAGADELPLDS